MSEENTDNIQVIEDVSNNNPDIENIKDMRIDYSTSQEEPSEKSPVKTMRKKIDRRSITSKQNALKARETRRRNYIERQRKMQELFGDSDTSSSEEELLSDSDTDEELAKQINRYKKHRNNKYEKEISELRGMIFKLAEKQKRQKKRMRNKAKSPQQQQQPTPVINYNIQPPKEETTNKPSKKMSLFEKTMRNKILED